MRLVTRTLATAAVGGVLALGAAAPAQAADKDCADFATQAEAQAFYTAQGGPARDPHTLDRDRDGTACERYFATGDRSQATTINSGIPATPATGGLVGGTLLLLAGAGVAVRAARRA